MIGWGLLLLLQVGAPTVGDTVWVSVTVSSPGRAILRPQPWDLGEVARVLGPPEVSSRGDSVEIRYPVAFWFPGPHALDIPGPIIVSPEGRSDTLSSRPITIRIGSVLPIGALPDSVAPRPEAALLLRRSTSLLPFLVFEGLALLLGAGAVVGWRRSQRPRPTPMPVAAPAYPPRGEHLGRWVNLGETRAALAGWSALLREELSRRSDPELREGARPLLEACEQARFGPADGATAERLVRAAREWLDRRGATG